MEHPYRQLEEADRVGVEEWTWREEERDLPRLRSEEWAWEKEWRNLPRLRSEETCKELSYEVHRTRTRMTPLVGATTKMRGVREVP